MQRIKTHFDSESRRIRRASSRVTTLCRFEQDPLKFVNGLKEVLVELRA